MKRKVFSRTDILREIQSINKEIEKFRKGKVNDGMVSVPQLALFRWVRKLGSLERNI